MTDATVDAVAAILATVPPGDDGLTREELAARIGTRIERVSVALKRHAAEGRLVVGTRPGLRIDGRRCQRPVYRVKP